MLRKTLLAVTAAAGLIGAAAAAAPAQAATPLYGASVQQVQWGGPGWRYHHWERHRRWVAWHRWHRHW